MIIDKNGKGIQAIVRLMSIHRHSTLTFFLFGEQYTHTFIFHKTTNISDPTPPSRDNVF